MVETFGRRGGGGGGGGGGGVASGFQPTHYTQYAAGIQREEAFRIELLPGEQFVVRRIQMYTLGGGDISGIAFEWYDQSEARAIATLDGQNQLYDGGTPLGKSSDGAVVTGRISNTNTSPADLAFNYTVGIE